MGEPGRQSAHSGAALCGHRAQEHYECKRSPRIQSGSVPLWCRDQGIGAATARVFLRSAQGLMLLEPHVQGSSPILPRTRLPVTHAAERVAPV